MSRDQKFFDMYSLVIGVLAAFALGILVLFYVVNIVGVKPAAAVQKVMIVFLLLGTVQLPELALVEEWPQFAVFTFLLFVLLMVYFLLLGLLGELAVTASGMHRRRVLDRVMTEGPNG